MVLYGIDFFIFRFLRENILGQVYSIYKNITIIFLGGSQNLLATLVKNKLLGRVMKAYIAIEETLVGHRHYT